MIEAIYIAPASEAAQQAVEEADLRAGAGIVGDRYYGAATGAGEHVTFVEAEEIERYNAEYRQSIRDHATRRNVVTRGVRLNRLVGRRFVIGQVAFVGIELCEPCRDLGASLANDTMPADKVVRAFAHRAGLRADVVTDGRIAVGMTIEPRAS